MKCAVSRLFSASNYASLVYFQRNKAEGEVKENKAIFQNQFLAAAKYAILQFPNFSAGVGKSKCRKRSTSQRSII